MQYSPGRLDLTLLALLGLTLATMAFAGATRAPLPEVPLVPTGGIGVDDIGAYLAAGAAAVGLGSPLLGDAGEPSGDLDALADRGRRAVAAATRTGR